VSNIFIALDLNLTLTCVFYERSLRLCRKNDVFDFIEFVVRVAFVVVNDPINLLELFLNLTFIFWQKCFGRDFMMPLTIDLSYNLLHKLLLVLFVLVLKKPRTNVTPPFRRLVTPDPVGTHIGLNKLLKPLSHLQIILVLTPGHFLDLLYSLSYVDLLLDVELVHPHIHELQVLDVIEFELGFPVQLG
jgi:hypothetical protein